MRSYWVLSYTNTRAPKAGGTPTDDKGKYLMISRRHPNASWRIARHIWNSNNPVPAPGVEYCGSDSRPVKCSSGSTEESD